MYSNLSVKLKLLAGFTVLLVLLLLSTVVALSKMALMNGETEGILRDNFPKTVLASEGIQLTLNNARLMRDLMIDDRPEPTIKNKQTIEDNRTKIKALIAKIDQSVRDPRSREIVGRMVQAQQAVQSEYDPFFDLINVDRVAARDSLVKEFATKNQALIATFQELSTHQVALMESSGRGVSDSFRASLYLLLAVLAASIGLGVLVALHLSGDLARRIGDARALADRVAQGNLTSHATGPIANDEIGQLMRALEQMRSDLARTINDILKGAHDVSSSAAQMSTAAKQVAVSSEEQSRSSATAAASIEELTVSIDHVGSGAEDASTRVADASDMATKSGREVDLATQTIERVAVQVDGTSDRIRALSEQVQEIDKITEVIRDVADQTNLLALNAAIEAARAGEQGRGFAVVADEVRKLAERTTSSVEEISTVISTIQRDAINAVDSMQVSRELVGEVVTAARTASGSMNHIRESAGAMREAIDGITHALREQRAAASNLAGTVESVAQKSEENSTAVNSVAVNAGQLAGVSETLKASVSRFRV